MIISPAKVAEAIKRRLGLWVKAEGTVYQVLTPETPITS